MRKTIICFLVLLFVLGVYSVSSFAEPNYVAIVDKNILSGIVPLSETDLRVDNMEMVVDYLFSDNIVTDDQVAQNAKITINYEVYNPSTEKEVTFALPLVYSFLNLRNDFEIKINDTSIEKSLSFSNSRIPLDSYFDIENFDYQSYQELLFKNYQLENDFDGFMYSFINPQPLLEDNPVDTRLIFSTIPEGTTFVDCSPTILDPESGEYSTGSNYYDGGEIGYFFSSEELEVRGVSYESLVGEQELEPESFTKQPMKLSEYIISYIDNHDALYDGIYQEEFKTYLLKFADDVIDSGEIHPDNNLFYSRLLIDDAIKSYQDISVEFTTNFEPQETKNIEINYYSPIFCDKEDYILEIIPNPGDHWSQIENTNFSIINTEKISVSSIPYNKIDDNYSFSDSSEKISITFNNSTYPASVGCGYNSSIFNAMNELFLLFIIVFTFRRK